MRIHGPNSQPYFNGRNRVLGKGMIGGRVNGSSGPSGGPSSVVIWEEGYDLYLKLTVDGPNATWSADADKANAIDTDQQLNAVSGSEKVYLEFEVMDIQASPGSGEWLAVGLRSAANAQGGTSQYTGIGMCWDGAAGGKWYATIAATTAAASATTSGATAPAIGDILGVAYDNANHKVYIHKNGVWMSGGSGGGEPSGGTGWVVASAGTDVCPHMAVDCALGSGPVTLRAANPQYTPDGYTAWT